MLYTSTRGNTETINFKDVTLKGLADDGGLYVPKKWTNTELYIDEKNPKFQDITFSIVDKFIGNLLSKSNLKSIINKSYEGFTSDEITPLKKISNNLWNLELFHGPTLAFKDIALQLLGNLFDYYLEKSNKKLNIIGATSGDTGSAAIEAVKDQKNSNIFILHPYKRVSEFQRRQMTTVNTNNVYNIAVKGTFDDCQELVKKLFNDKYTNKEINLGSINSINWTRIMAQISYYVFAYYKIKKETNKEIVFSVPTGNFGDAYAGYIAKEKFNIPFKKILVATNKNDILNRFFKSGIYKQKEVSKTLSPSMDIQIASNFERLLYDLYDQNGKDINSFMNKLKEERSISVSNEKLQKARTIFYSSKVTEKETIDTIKEIYKVSGQIIDPHTAVGIKTAKNYLEQEENCEIITLATAHPVKFTLAVEKALGKKPALPEKYERLFDNDEKYEVFENSFNDIKSFIISHAIR